MKRFYLLIPALLSLAFPAHADLIKQSGTYTRTVLMTSSSDHISGATGLTLTVQLSKAGGTPATITPTVTPIGSGRYAIALASGNTDTLGALDMIITATGADPSDTHDQVYSALDSNAISIASVPTAGSGGTITFPNGTVGTYSGTPPTPPTVTQIRQEMDANSNKLAWLTGDAFVRMGAPTGANIAADIQTRLAASGYTAAPTTTAIAAAILGNGGTVTLSMDASGRVLLQPSQTFNTTGNITGNITGNLSGSVGGLTGYVAPTNADTSGVTTLLSRIGTPATTSIAADIATRSTFTAPADYLSAGERTQLTAAGSAGDPWTTLLTAETTAGSFGTFLKTALPNAAAGAAGGLVKLDAAGRNSVNLLSYTTQAAGGGTVTLNGDGTSTSWLQSTFAFPAGTVSTFAGGAVASVTGNVGGSVSSVTSPVAITPVLDSGALIAVQNMGSAFFGLALSATTVPNAYQGATLIMTTGAAAGQSKYINLYGGNGARRAYTTTGFTSAPSAGDSYVVVLGAGVNRDGGGNVYLSNASAGVMGAAALPAVDANGNVFVATAANGAGGSVNFAANIRDYAGISSADLTAIFGATAGTYNGAGTMGAKLNTAAGYTIPTAAAIASAVFASTLQGGLTFLQSQNLQQDLLYDNTRTVSGSTATLTWYARLSNNSGPDLTKPVMVKVTTYSSSALTSIVSQSVTLTPANLN